MLFAPLIVMVCMIYYNQINGVNNNMDQILSRLAVSVTELRERIAKIVEEAGDEPIAVLNKNKPIAYLIPANKYEEMLEVMKQNEKS